MSTPSTSKDKATEPDIGEKAEEDLGRLLLSKVKTKHCLMAIYKFKNPFRES